MIFLPIVARELRVAAPRRSTYWVRTAAGLSVVLIGTWFFLVMQQEPPQTIALTLFGILTGGAVLYCLLSGGWCTADCLSEEKREGTLGLLFLTDLKGYDVVLGKLAASSLNAIYGALAVVPMLAIPCLLGGVTLGEVGRMALVAINALFFSLAMGMCFAAMSRSALKAVVITLLLLFLFSAMAPACGFWLAHFRRTRGLEKHLLMLSPWFSFYAAFDQNYKTAAKEFWDSLLTIHALG